MSVSNNFSCILLNARSIQNKRNHLELLLAYQPYDIVGITESWVPDSDSDTFSMPDYNCFAVGRLTQRGGGAIILVNYALVSCKVDALSVRIDNLEVVSCELLIDSRPLCLLLCIYRSPQANFQTDTFLFDIFQRASEYLHKYKCIMGDFNLPLIRWDVQQWPVSMELYIDAFYENAWSQHVDFSTRGANILDLVFVNDPEQINNCET